MTTNEVKDLPATAPDSSVERVVDDMRKMAADRWTPYGVRQDVTALADRLQALARGPQQAGGEDAMVRHLARTRDVALAEVARLSEVVVISGGVALACSRVVGEAFNALQAEVARLREAGRPVGYVYSEIVEVEGAEPVRIKRAALQGEYAQSLPNGTALYAALNGGQDDG